jgi:hypothetical protein
MGVLPFEPNPRRASGTVKRRHFWRSLAERLDALVAYPTKHVMPERDWRRVDADIKRCRQLMLKKTRHRRNAKLGRRQAMPAFRAIKAR